MKRLFGTDGIRAVAGRHPLDPPTVRRFGAALAETLARAERHRPRVVIGRDTRESGPWLRDAVASGLRSRGAEVVDAGVVTTPGLAHGARARPFDAGVMISASHNPFQDNGLKVFGHDGTKLPDSLEAEIENRILDTTLPDPGPAPGAVNPDDSLVRDYVKALEEAVRPRGRFAGVRLVLDCANGAASAIAPEVFRHHGAEVATLGTSPDGKNINLGCGSLHLESLAEAVRGGGHLLGIAFDGDADRCLAVDRRGRTVDGDHILYLMARRMHRERRLRGDVVVATVMSNFWLERKLLDDGIRLARAPVGDKYVLERMVSENAAIGGEQSGHVIFRDHATTGDGILTGLLLLDTLLASDRPLEEVLDGIEPFPQILLNVRVRSKPDFGSMTEVASALREAEIALSGSGRVLLRYSGTEPLARVMVEGSDAEAVRILAERIAAAIRREIGEP